MLALGVDVGSTSTKVALVRIGTGGDAQADVRTLRVSTARTPAGANDLVATVLRLVRDVLARRVDAADTGHHAALETPGVVGVASMAESGVPLDLRGEPLTEILRWDTARADEAARGLSRTLGAEQLFAATGVRVSSKTPMAVWAWLRAERPDVARAMARWSGVADLVVLAMTGRLATDHTLAGRTMAYRLPGPGEDLPGSFDPTLLGAVALRPEQLPDVLGPEEAAGLVTSSAFAAAGVPLRTPVVVAGHDHAVAAWAAGVREPGAAADSVGTAEAVMTVLPPGPIDPAAVAAAGMSLVRTASGRHEALVAGNPSAGALLRSWIDALAAAGIPVPEQRPGPPRPAGALVLPYPGGRRCPSPDPDARLRLIAADGVDRAWPPVAEPELWTRAIIEGLSLHARWMLEEQAQIAGARPTELVVISGAPETTAAWVAVKAAASAVPVRVVESPEPVAAGAALLAARRAGLIPEPAPHLRLRPPADTPTGSGEGAHEHAYDRAYGAFLSAARR